MPGIKIPIGRGIRPRYVKSWSSYWASLISATVENAAPTHVVLTFPTANPTLGASDFTIAGFTISSASWTGVVLTLVTSVAVTAYRGNFLITFVTTGQTATVTNNVAIANTVGWYAHGDGSATYVTKDGSDFVSVWKDLSGANHPLNQATGTKQPKWEVDGILFDGNNDEMLATGFGVSAEAVTVYAILKQITWSDEDTFWDSQENTGFRLHQRVSSPKIRYQGPGTVNYEVIDLTLDTFSLIVCKVAGVNSLLSVNNNVVSGNFGLPTFNGLWLGRIWTAGANIHAKFAEIIIRKAEDDATTINSIKSYLGIKYGLTF